MPSYAVLRAFKVERESLFLALNHFLNFYDIKLRNPLGIASLLKNSCPEWESNRRPPSFKSLTGPTLYGLR